jgi:hypothetical protein
MYLSYKAEAMQQPGSNDKHSINSCLTPLDPGCMRRETEARTFIDDSHFPSILVVKM